MSAYPACPAERRRRLGCRRGALSEKCLALAERLICLNAIGSTCRNAGLMTWYGWIVPFVLALTFVGLLVVELWDFVVDFFMNAQDRHRRRQKSFRKPRRRKDQVDAVLAEAEMAQKVDELIAASTHDKPHPR